MSRLGVAFFFLLSAYGLAQSGGPSRSTPNQRSFSVSAAAINAALNKLQPTFSGRLPTLDGFVIVGQRSLEQYRRPFYQCTVHVDPSPGGSLVRVTAKITAWHENPPSSGYEVLQSNGRLETDLLDRLQESLTPKSANVQKSQPAPEISAPMPQLPQHTSATGATPLPSADSPLREEARSLEELLRNQSRPTNLVGVKRDQTPILEAARADAKVLFMASAEDEFELLDQNPEWVHVRISGLSRGWLRRSGIEILDGSQTSHTETPARQSAGSSPTNSLFSVSSEEIGTFPGSWDALKGKSARIISVQQAPSSGRITSPQEKLQFAASVFRKEVLATGVNGLVLIFDTEDGGMVASGKELLDQWKRGAISEADFWKQCYLDPPEILGTRN